METCNGNQSPGNRGRLILFIFSLSFWLKSFHVSDIRLSYYGQDNIACRAAGIAQLQSDGLVIERSRVRVPAKAAREFSSPGSAFCVDSYFGIRSTPVLQHVKDPGHSAKSAGDRLQLNTHTLSVCGCVTAKLVHGCMVYTELEPRRQQFHGGRRKYTNTQAAHDTR